MTQLTQQTNWEGGIYVVNMTFPDGKLGGKCAALLTRLRLPDQASEV